VQAECKRKFTFSLLRRSRFSRAFARNAPFLGPQEGVGVVVTPKPKAWQNCYSGLHFVCCPIRYSEKKTKTLLFVLLFTRLALLCRCAAKIGCGSEKLK
jgi:hypothetical protein